MNLTFLTSVSPVDGRYRSKCSELPAYFSEYALFRYRVLVEVEYLIALCHIPLPALQMRGKEVTGVLKKISLEFSEEDALQIKEIEKTTNHDIKAVEYFIREKLIKSGYQKEAEYVHFALTSQDINNTAVPLSIKDCMFLTYLPLLKQVTDKLHSLSGEWKNIAMLARTHGQPASPTRLGKEMSVFSERIENQVVLLNQIPFSAKFGGATGNFNAHHAAFPEIDWKKFADQFVHEKLGLARSQTTTQIEHYDNLAALFDNLKRINTILIDLNRDIWAYVSLNYFKQKIKKDEVGSSAMPHKVNPIDFENSEGNLGIANALFEHFSAKLPISRLQRDLTDSTVLRNTGVPFAHTVIAMKSLLAGLNKIYVNEEAIKKDLDSNWAVVTEAIQVILKREGVENAYEKLKEFSRTGDVLTQSGIEKFIDSLDIPTKIKSHLKSISPHNYTGI